MKRSCFINIFQPHINFSFKEMQRINNSFSTRLVWSNIPTLRNSQRGPRRSLNSVVNRLTAFQLNNRENSHVGNNQVRDFVGNDRVESIEERLLELRRPYLERNLRRSSETLPNRGRRNYIRNSFRRNNSRNKNASLSSLSLNSVGDEIYSDDD